MDIFYKKINLVDEEFYSGTKFKKHFSKKTGKNNGKWSEHLNEVVTQS